MNSRTGALLATAFAAVAWGTTYVVTRQVLPSVPLFGSAARALPAGLIILALTRTLPRGSWWWRTALISTLTMGGFFVLIYVAGQRLPSSVASTVMALSPLVMMALARLLLTQPMHPRAVAGGLAGVLGVGLLVGAGTGTIDALGLLASFAGMVSSALGFVLTQRWRPPVGPLPFVGWQLTMAGLLLTPISLALEGPPPALSGAQLVAFAYMTLVATALAYVCWFHGLTKLSASTVGLVGLLNPVAGTLLGTLAAGERLTPTQLLGAAVILLGVVLGTQSGRPRPTE